MRGIDAMKLHLSGVAAGRPFAWDPQRKLELTVYRLGERWVQNKRTGQWILLAERLPSVIIRYILQLVRREILPNMRAWARRINQPRYYMRTWFVSDREDVGRLEIYRNPNRYIETPQLVEQRTRHRGGPGGTVIRPSYYGPGF